MKTVTKDKPLDLTEIEKLPLLERQRIFKEFLVNSKNKDVLRLINDEIKKTEFEEEELEKLEDIPKKKEEETKGQNLSNSFGLKKMTDMYSKHKKGEHEHGH